MVRKDFLRGLGSQRRRRASKQRTAQRFGPRLESLEDKILLAVSIAEDPGQEGRYQVTFDSDDAYADDDLTLKLNGSGLLSYAWNGAPLSTDLDTSQPGLQERSIGDISRITVILRLGTNTLLVDQSAGAVTGSGRVLDYQGTSAQNSESPVANILEVIGQDTNYVGDDTQLTTPQSEGVITYTNIDVIRVTTGDADNTIDFSSFSGAVVVNAGGGDDTVYGGNGNDILYGGAGNDVLVGNGGNDELYGQDGVDTLNGGAGDDLQYGGDGDDLLQSGGGYDYLYGEGGNDELNQNLDGSIVAYGGAGNDLIHGGDGNDLIYGGDGDDSLYGGQGDDHLIGEAGNDYLNGELGDDHLEGDVGSDTLVGDDGNDILDGGDDNDYLYGNDGNDTLLGGAGQDQLFGLDGLDILDGGDGNDYVVGGNDADQLQGGDGNDLIEGGDGSDTLNGGAGRDTLRGEAGDDTLSGEEGDDFLYGGDGNDQLNGGAGNDLQYGGIGNDVLISGGGNDTIYGEDGNDEIYQSSDGSIIASGGSGNDTIVGGDGADQIEGDDGEDTLDGQGGDDVIYGGDPAGGPDGADIIYGGAGNDTIDGSGGDDVIRGESGDDTIRGGLGNDALLGGDGDDVLRGEDGSDSLYGDSGNDDLDGGADNDSLSGGIGDDTLQGGQGDDGLQGDAGNDVLTGGPGNDSLDGGSGQDRVVAQADANITLTDSQLSIFGVENDTITGIELATLTGGPSANTINTSSFTGEATLDGGGGSDTIIGGDNQTSFTGIVAPTDNLTLVGGTGTNDYNLDIQGRVAIVDNGGDNTLNLTSTNEGVTLDLRINDGTDQVVTTTGATVSLTGKFTKVYGTAFADTIWGDAFGTVLYGGLGSDIITGGSGGDTIYGGTGPGDLDGSDDVIYGGLGADVIDGGGGNDTIYGGTGVDDIDLSPDTIYGGLGTDIIFGGNGNDTIYGGTAAGSNDLDDSNDVIFGGLGADILDGGVGNDTIYGGTATGTADLDNSNDTIYGGIGSDAIDGGRGNDTIYGGTGSGLDDEDSSPDLIYGGLGTDVIDGGLGNDTIYGGTAGGAGDVDTSADTIYGGLGSDVIDGGRGNDTIYGGTAGGPGDLDASPDTIYGGLGTDVIDGGGGSDTIYGGTAGGPGDSDLSADTIYGGLGADIIDGGGGNDTIYGGTAGSGSDLDTSADTIYGGLGADIIDAGGGNDTIFGGIASGGVGGDQSNDTIYGGTGDDTIAGEGGDDQLDGGAGNDRYIFAGLSLGNDLIVEAPGADRDTLDFSAFGAPITIDLSRTDKQTVSGTDLSLTLWSSTAIEDVDGTRFNDKITGNSRDNQIRGADFLDQRDGAGLPWDGRTQVVYLDFDSNTGIDYLGKPKAEHVYTQAERDAIQQAIQASYAGFNVVVTQTLPGSGLYATLSFNETPVYGGGPQPGGIADELDLGNKNLGGKALIDVNDLLGKGSQPAATSANFIAMSATIAAHEMGHLMGLRHADSFGPIGTGMHNPPGAGSTIPFYPGPVSAPETTWHMMASPASVGASLFDTLAGPFFGEREAIKLAYAMAGGPSAPETVGTKGNLDTAQTLGWTALSVQNTLKRGLNAFKDLSASFLSVSGSIGLTGGGTSENDYYAFTARAGDLINLDLYSVSLKRILNKIDGIVRILDSLGNVLPFGNGTAESDDNFENQDPAIIDLSIPADGTYYIVVDTFSSGAVADTATGDYQLFGYRFDAGNAVAGNDGIAGGQGTNSLQGGRGNDTYGTPGIGNDTITDLGGTDKLDFAAMPGGVTIDLSKSAGQKQTFTRLGSVTLYGTFENVAGSAFNDTITGNDVANILIGNDGDDVLIGGAGRDLLVGGNGADRIDGGADDDILIGGRTTFDAQDAALAAIMAEWTSNAAYSTRVARISGQATGGANGSTILVRGTTIIDSTGPDTLTGGAGLDLFYIPNKNRVSGKEAAEVIL